MKTSEIESLKINKRSIRGNCKAVSFKEGDFMILYIPSLNLSSYGKNISEAQKMMNEVVLPDFCRGLMSVNKKRAFDELRKLGWEQRKFFEKELRKTAYIDKEGILRDFDLEKGTEISEQEVSILC